MVSHNRDQCFLSQLPTLLPSDHWVQASWPDNRWPIAILDFHHTPLLFGSIYRVERMAMPDQFEAQAQRFGSKNAVIEVGQYVLRPGPPAWVEDAIEFSRLIKRVKRQSRSSGCILRLVQMDDHGWEKFIRLLLMATALLHQVIRRKRHVSWLSGSYQWIWQAEYLPHVIQFRWLRVVYTVYPILLKAWHSDYYNFQISFASIYISLLSELLLTLGYIILSLTCLFWVTIAFPRVDGPITVVFIDGKWTLLFCGPVHFQNRMMVRPEKN